MKNEDEKENKSQKNKYFIGKFTIVYIILFVFILSGCKKEKGTIQIDSTNNIKLEKSIDVNWYLEFTGSSDKLPQDKYKLFLQTSDKINQPDDFYIGEYEGDFSDGEIENNDIPEDNILKGMNRFSGAGNYFYCTVEANNIVIYEQSVGDDYFGSFEEIARLYIEGDHINAIETKVKTIDNTVLP